MLSAVLRRFFPGWHPEPKAPDVYLGLTSDQCQSVVDLQAHPGWKHYCKALEWSAAVQAKPLLSGLLDRDQYLFQAGVLEALRRLAALPESVSSHLRNLHDRADRRSRADAAPIDPFLSTVWYDLASRPNGGSPAASGTGVPVRPRG